MERRNSSHHATCHSVVDDYDLREREAAIDREPAPQSRPAKKTSVCASSDSGYSSSSKTYKDISSSRASSGLTVTPNAPPSAYRTPTTANVTSQAASTSRSQSKTRTSNLSRTLSKRDQPSMQQSGGRWVPPGGSVTSTRSAPSPMPPSAPNTAAYAQPALAPSAPPYGPAPAAIPRQRPPPAPRPISIATPGAHMYPPPPYQHHTPGGYYQTPVLTHQPPALPPAQAHMPPPPRPEPRPASHAGGTGGMWVRHDPGAARVSHPPPPAVNTSRPALHHRPTDATVATNRRASMYGEPVTHQSSTPPTSYYDPMRSSRQPGYPPNSSARQSLYGTSPYYPPEGDYFDRDPDRTVRPSRRESSVRPPLPDYRAGTSRSETHYIPGSGRHAHSSMVVERTTPSMGRDEKIGRYIADARQYQDNMDRSAGADPDEDLDEHMGRLELDAPPSPVNRRSSQSRHTRSVSRATSNYSRGSTDGGMARFEIVGNAVEVSGDTGGHQISISAGESGRPTITLGSSSPTHTRERSYPAESVRSHASYAERSRRRSSLVSAPATEVSVASSSGRRRESVARRK
ncbi:MAG: hypothetical protein Q9159_001935 [Coniocarpon cinnabarinum]